MSIYEMTYLVLLRQIKIQPGFSAFLPRPQVVKAEKPACSLGDEGQKQDGFSYLSK
jgi:hypothetical protein